MRLIYFLCILLFLGSAKTNATTFYVDSTNGSNGNNGTSHLTPWQSVEKVNETTFQPGDSILFVAGGEWNAQLWPKGSGEAGNPIVVDMYGFGEKPLLFGKNGAFQAVVHLYNQEYWTIRNLEITNDKSSTTSQLLYGVHILAEDFGIVHNIKLQNLHIHNVKGALNVPGDANLAKENGGIFYEILGETVETIFDSLIIEGCLIQDVDRVGITNKSSWWVRTLTTNTNWVPSTNIIIRNNRIERAGGNGLIIRESVGALIEHNVFHENGLKVNGNAMFTFNCDDAVIQYNESCHTVYNSGDVDASGYDGDFRCKRTLFQYNYSHDNDGGFMVVVCLGGPTRFNDGVIVRYNLSVNDGVGYEGAVFHIAGQTTNTFIYNNTVYIKPGSSANVIKHSAWEAWPDKTFYYNNIFYNWSFSGGKYLMNSSTNNFFDYNLYSGFHPESEPEDVHKITDDPQFVNAGETPPGLQNLTGYQLKSASPAINAGKMIDNNGGIDFWGNPVPYASSNPDIGAHEFQGDPTSISEEEILPKGYNLLPNFPNPFNPKTVIPFYMGKAGLIKIDVFNANGQKIRSLLNNTVPAGLQQIVWTGDNDRGEHMPAGVYYARAKAQNLDKTIKMVLIK